MADRIKDMDLLKEKFAALYDYLDAPDRERLIIGLKADIAMLDRALNRYPDEKRMKRARENFATFLETAERISLDHTNQEENRAMPNETTNVENAGMPNDTARRTPLSSDSLIKIAVVSWDLRKLSPDEQAQFVYENLELLKPAFDAAVADSLDHEGQAD
jgi:hypothetical protein